MAFVIADRVRETSTSTGTGSFTLAGAVTGYQTFASALASGDTTYYTIADQGGANWEVGIGTFTSPSTLARTTILSSSNGGSVVTFGAGTKDVFISLPASKTVQSFSAGSTGLSPSTATFGPITLSGTLAAANGGTGQSSYTIGDLLYASGTTALSKLADVATGNALISGGVGAAPSYGKIGLTTHVSGTLGVGNGGTGTATTFTTGSVVFAGASGVYSQNNSQIFWDNTNSRLGVGTSAPSYKLHVNSSSGDAILATSVTGGGNGAGLLRLFGSDTSTYSAYNSIASLNSDASQQWLIGGQGNTNTLTFQTGTSERMRIDSSGNVGIGTSSPTDKFQVNSQDGVRLGASGATSYARIGSANTGEGTAQFAYDRAAGDIFFSIGNTGSALTERMRITSAGNVGIGTSSPSVKLAVNGTLAFDSGYGSVATAYGCRAWVNFNGTGTVAIRSSGNVTSITDNNTGDYTVNFTNAMPDANYSYEVSAGNPTDVPRICLNATGGTQTESAPTTSSCRFFINNAANSAQLDCKYINVAIFR